MIRFWRKWHRWVSIVIAIPFTLILVTGLILSTRGFNRWMQPQYPPLSSTLDITFNQILERTRQIPEAQVRDWGDVSQIDIRPGKGNIRVRSRHNHWEVQIDGATGEILTSAPRRVSWFVALHEGALFGPWVRYGIFFPSALGVLFLLISGLVIIMFPYLKKNPHH